MDIKTVICLITLVEQIISFDISMPPPAVVCMGSNVSFDWEYTTLQQGDVLTSISMLFNEHTQIAVYVNQTDTVLTSGDKYSGRLTRSTTNAGFVLANVTEEDTGVYHIAISTVADSKHNYENNTKLTVLKSPTVSSPGFSLNYDRTTRVLTCSGIASLGDTILAIMEPGGMIVSETSTDTSITWTVVDITGLYKCNTYYNRTLTDEILCDLYNTSYYVGPCEIETCDCGLGVCHMNREICECDCSRAPCSLSGDHCQIFDDQNPCNISPCDCGEICEQTCGGFTCTVGVSCEVSCNLTTTSIYQRVEVLTGSNLTLDIELIDPAYSVQCDGKLMYSPVCNQAKETNFTVRCNITSDDCFQNVTFDVYVNTDWTIYHSSTASEVIVNEGEELYIPFIISGGPAASVQWTKTLSDNTTLIHTCQHNAVLDQNTTCPHEEVSAMEGGVLDVVVCPTGCNKESCLTMALYNVAVKTLSTADNTISSTLPASSGETNMPTTSTSSTIATTETFVTNTGSTTLSYDREDDTTVVTEAEDWTTQTVVVTSDIPTSKITSAIVSSEISTSKITSATVTSEISTSKISSATITSDISTSRISTATNSNGISTVTSQESDKTSATQQTNQDNTVGVTDITSQSPSPTSAVSVDKNRRVTAVVTLVIVAYIPFAQIILFVFIVAGMFNKGPLRRRVRYWKKYRMRRVHTTQMDRQYPDIVPMQATRS